MNALEIKKIYFPIHKLIQNFNSHLLIMVKLFPYYLLMQYRTNHMNIFIKKLFPINIHYLGILLFYHYIRIIKKVRK